MITVDTLLRMVSQARALGRKPVSWRFGRQAWREIADMQYRAGAAAGIYTLQPSYDPKEGGYVIGIPFEVTDEVSPESANLVLE